MLYSASTNAFYDEAIHNRIPEDVVGVSDERFKEILEGKEKGQVVVADNKGNPILVDAPAPTPEQEQAARNEEARRYLSDTDWYVVRKMETGVEIPQDILDKRAAARLSVVE